MYEIEGAIGGKEFRGLVDYIPGFSFDMVTTPGVNLDRKTSQRIMDEVLAVSNKETVNYPIYENEAAVLFEKKVALRCFTGTNYLEMREMMGQQLA